MKEYIEKADAINLLWLFADESCASVVSDFEGLPAADVAEVRHGKWVEYPRAHYFKCSECKYTVPYRKAIFVNGNREYDYCPSCGARMDKEDEHEVS